jgi:hypothetical protein
MKTLKQYISEKFSSDQVQKLKKAYEPLKGKKVNPTPLMKTFDKIDKNKDALIQLYKADIPFVSTMAMSRLISKHNYKASDIKKLGKIRMEYSIKEYGGGGYAYHDQHPMPDLNDISAQTKYLKSKKKTPGSC